MSLTADLLARIHPSGYDRVRRRRATRAGKQAGASIYLAAEELVRAGWPLDGPPPYYRVWGAGKGRVIINLYDEP